MVTPAGGTRALFGSNPLAFGFPAAPDPVLVDLSTAAVTRGQLLVCERDGRPLPEGVAVDAAGRPTTDAAAAREGALRPTGGHRGSALGAAVQLLASALTGATVFPLSGRGYGLLLVGLARGAFGGDAAYDAAVAEFTAGVAACPAAPGEVVRPPGARRWENSRRVGAWIEVDDDLAARLGLGAPA